MATNNFLSTKAFHPGSKANRTKVYQAEQRAKEEGERAKERQTVLAREQEHFTKASAGKVGQLAFMYAQPRPEHNTAPDAQRRREMAEAEAREQARLSETRLRKGAGDEWCSRCNVRGHSAGALDCALREADASNPFAARLEDPHALIELRKRQLRAEGAIDASAVLTVTFQRAVDPNDPNNQLLEDPPDEPRPAAGEDEELRVEKQFLASLSAEDKALLVRHFAGEQREKKRQKKERKKEKKRDKRDRKERKRVKTEKDK
jgi:hypothetical protein